MERRFAGKVALVTGATTGIGQATAVRLATDGALVGVNRKPGLEAEETRAMVKAAGGEAFPVAADMRDPAQVKAIKAVATDGFTVNYDMSQVLADDVIVAYATADGELSADDGSFRMVLPNAEGKLNVRMLAELQVIQ